MDGWRKVELVREEEPGNQSGVIRRLRGTIKVMRPRNLSQGGGDGSGGAKQNIMKIRSGVADGNAGAEYNENKNENNNNSSSKLTKNSNKVTKITIQ